MKLFKPSIATTAACTASTMMRAVVQNGYGPPELVLSMVNNATRPSLEDKKGGEDQKRGVLVRVVSTSVNTPDWANTLGVPYILRLGTGIFRPRKQNKILGSDIAGIVEQVGTEVTEWKPGDHVFGTAEGETGGGSFAEYVVTKPEKLCRKPKFLSFDQAVACVMSGVTALTTIRDGAKVAARTTAAHDNQGSGSRSKKQHILINGASGGVGTFAIQMAKALGGADTTIVTAVCSGKNQALVRSLGADHVIDYTQTDYTAVAKTCGDADEDTRKYDVILDNVMNRSYKENARVLKEDGYVIPNSLGIQHDFFGTIPRFLFKPSNYPATNCNVQTENLQAVADLVESGKVQVVIDKVFSLEEAPQAVAYMARHHAAGNVVIRVSEDEQ